MSRAISNRSRYQIPLCLDALDRNHLAPVFLVKPNASLVAHLRVMAGGADSRKTPHLRSRFAAICTLIDQNREDDPCQVVPACHRI